MHDVRTYKVIARSIPPDHKRAMSRALPHFLARGGLRGPPHLVRQHAASALKQNLPLATQTEIDALTVNFLGQVAVSLRGTAAETSGMALLSPTETQSMAARFRLTADARDEVSEMGEMESLRLQMMMDRSSKAMSTLANILKAMTDTQAAVAANLS